MTSSVHLTREPVLNLNLWAVKCRPGDEKQTSASNQKYEKEGIGNLHRSVQKVAYQDQQKATTLKSSFFYFT